MKTFLLATLILSSVFADYKNTESLYHDTSKSVHQSISLHNVKAEPAEVITRTEIRRVPRYEYYNVYKTKTVWKCLPNGGGGGGTTPPIVVKKYWTYTEILSRASTGKASVFSGNALNKGWSVSSTRTHRYTVCSPCGNCRSATGRNFGYKDIAICGVKVRYQFLPGAVDGALIHIYAGSH